MEAHDRQKSYVDRRRNDLEFEVVDRAYLRAIPFRGRKWIFKNGKLNPRYIRAFRIISRVGAVAYKLDLPETMKAFHDVFHMSHLRIF